jgi:hypothetical protein
VVGFIQRPLVQYQTQRKGARTFGGVKKMQEQIKTQATDTSALTDIKSNLDIAWGKIEKGLAQEAEGKKLWIEGTLELINILDDARKRFPSDKEFGTWLTDNGYGVDRLKRNDRTALLNMAMALDQNLTRQVLEQTHRRSWRLIWEEEVQPLLHSAVQPADGESPEANPANNSEQSAGEKKPTRRPRRSNGTRKPKEEWGKELKDFLSDGLLAANALIRIKNSIQQCTPEKQAELKEQKVTAEWSEKIGEGSKASAWICDWANGLLEEEADALEQQGRVVRTPARASKQVQPEA